MHKPGCFDFKSKAADMVLGCVSRVLLKYLDNLEVTSAKATQLQETWKPSTLERLRRSALSLLKVSLRSLPPEVRSIAKDLCDRFLRTFTGLVLSLSIYEIEG